MVYLWTMISIYYWTTSTSVLIVFVADVISADMLPACHPEDYKYSFTECDESGGRWRVSVPNTPNTCTGGAPNPATRVDKCYTSCDFGHYFNSSRLSCEKCRPGYYSLGGGIRIESFNRTSLPAGFHITTGTINTSSGSCTGWRIATNYLESQSNSTSDGCVSKLSYTVRIVKKGKLSFRYQYSIPDDLANAILFTFQYHNYDESGGTDRQFDQTSDSKFPAITDEQQKWRDIQINLLTPGLYVFIWRSVLIGRSRGYFPSTVGFRSSSAAASSAWFGSRSGGSPHSDTGVIRIKNIFVDGVAYASECSPCEPGTYSPASGAASCTPCPPNTANPERAATECLPCSSTDKYSLKGSTHCISRPFCGRNDYYSIESECDLVLHKKTVEYKWIEPKICHDVNNVLPKTNTTDCTESSSSTTDNELSTQSCNLGQELSDDRKLCQFCGNNQYRDQTMSKCQTCPPSTTPHYSLLYNIWYPLPQFMTTECIHIVDNLDVECDDSELSSWLSNPYIKHYIRTGPSTELGAYLFLTLTVPGFRRPNGGQIQFKFQLDCEPDDSCFFMFLETRHTSGGNKPQQSNIIKEWDHKTTGIQSYRYGIDRNISVAFSWVFQRNYSFQSNAKIFEIQVTDILANSAIKCNPCPHSNHAYCIPCPIGQYMDTGDDSNSNNNNITDRLHKSEPMMARSRNRLQTKVLEKCKQCPPNRIINSSIAFPIGSTNSCIDCGLGLKDYKGISCYSDCHLNIDGDSFDLSQVRQPLLHRGGRLFTANGVQYYHIFNITLCGQPDLKSICINNVTSFESSSSSSSTTTSSSDSSVESTDGSAEPEEYAIRSMICRSTIIPDRDQTYSSQSVSLGDQLVGITRSTQYQNITVHPEFQSTNSDIHFYYSTPVPTNACPSGRRLTLTLRCAPELDQNLTIRTPNACPDGTCDGCTFHLLVKTKTAAACRLCRPEDYETVVGECLDGVQQIHLVNPKGCIISTATTTTDPDSTPTVQTRHCSVIPRQVQLGIALFSAVGVLLMVLVFHFWKKNRSLEYKYCKLVEGSDKSTGAECCVDDDDEDEEDDNDDNDNDDQVIIHPKKKLPKDVYEEGYETIQLTKHSDRNNTNII
ncbi:endosome/lysosome-associated apoptosis and autophagy regulator family member 2-like [Oppia nitens]|uniref:endosome/lysosome-associated apoptosis and autophagy regulator family member 2-like n=1 Tax=Oppia nitens TaxID=1686743 RepID=UPI0023DCB7B3|nr:endosome/lysosome-associated apoptosis and autophagy regulator family member 2-like [Oppia nitens]